ncbi:MAG: hypothetical protein WBO58_09095 [Gammaproteobacteria bacterium]
MDIQRLLTGLSLKIIIQFGVVITAAILLVAFNLDLIYPFYFENQLTNTGIVINSAILALLVVGLGNIFYHLLRYRREENAIAGFVNNVESIRPDLMEGLPADSIVVKRQLTMQSIQRANGEINHGALASMLNADEATHFGLIRFINNILILTGVFGTIVSLSIALLGASDLIDSANASLGGMGLVIHGMSTALSTTITAIISYVIFGYFYTRLNDVQTHCLSGIEQLTSIYLLPRYVKSSDDIVHKMSDLIKSVIYATDKLKKTQDTYQEAATTLQQTINTNQQQIDQLVDEIHGIKQILRDGFRLPLTDKES